MPTNYDEALRRVNEVVNKITEKIEAGGVTRSIGETIIRGFNCVIAEMKEVYVGTGEGQEEYREYLQKEFVLGEIPHDMKEYDPHADPVRGLVGIGSNCDIPHELHSLESAQRLD